MVQAQDLRIGNYIHAIDKVEPIIVCSIKSSEVKDGNFCLINGYIQDHISGVKIERYWLQLMGFKHNDYRRNLYHYKKYRYNTKTNSLVIMMSNNESHFISHVYFINHLQNLIFSLTNQELKPELLNNKI